MVKSRYNYGILESTADIVDVGAISTRPGAEDVSQEEEWRRLKGFVENWHSEKQLSVDTTRAAIVKKVYEAVGPFIVNDISAGEDDAQMLKVVGELALPYIAMHKRGNPTRWTHWPAPTDPLWRRCASISQISRRGPRRQA